jgi:hypothetical protein
LKSGRRKIVVAPGVVLESARNQDENDDEDEGLRWFANNLISGPKPSRASSGPLVFRPPLVPGYFPRLPLSGVPVTDTSTQ